MKRRERRNKFPRSKSNWLDKINIFKCLSIFLIILFTFCIPVVIKRLIKIDKIECKSQFGTCTKTFQLGDYSFVKKQIEQELKQNIQVESYLIQYKIPSTIKIDLILKKPIYAIRNFTNDFYLVDKDGTVLEISKESNLPFLTKGVNYFVGEKISDKDKFALSLLQKVRIINTVTTAEVKDEGLEVRVENGITVKFPVTGDVDVLAGSLKLIFSRLNDETRGIRIYDIREIDLRFKSPILRRR